MAGLFISLLSLCQSDESLVRHFLFFFTYLAVEGTATFLTIIVSSVLGDAVVAAYSIVYNMCIRLLSLGIILKLIDLFEFDFLLFMRKNLKNI